MTEQVVDVCEEAAILSKKPKAWYRWYCNKCGNKGKTTLRSFECHPLSTRITIDGDDE